MYFNYIMSIIISCINCALESEVEKVCTLIAACIGTSRVVVLYNITIVIV